MAKQTREQWLAERKTGLGGTDAPAVCGQSKWRTPLDVYLDKTGPLVIEPESDDQRRGKLLEPVVLQMYADATGMVLKQPNKMVRHKKHKFLLANLDSVANDKILVDAKTARDRSAWGEPGTDQVPQDYLFQVQHYMLVTELDLAEVAVLFGNFEFAIFTVPADHEFQEMILEEEAKFWDLVEKKQPPEPQDASDAVKLWPKAKAKLAVQASEITLGDIHQLREAKAAAAHIEIAKENLESKIKAAMGEAEQLLHGDQVLATWNNVAGRRTFDAKTLQKEDPDLYARYMLQGEPGRRFMLKPKKDD